MGTQRATDQPIDPGRMYVTGSERADGFLDGLTAAAVLVMVAILIVWTAR